ILSSNLHKCSDSVSVGDFCGSLSPVEFTETPKENIRLPVTPKERIRESRGAQQPSALSWCETPKVHKRDASLRHRLQMCKPNTDVKGVRSPCTRRTESSGGAGSAHWLSASFDSLDTLTGALASSTLNLEQDLPLSGGKRRLLFSQIRTSTREDGKLHSGLPAEFATRVSLSAADFSQSFSASDHVNIETPCCRKSLSVSEDSGFSSLTLDKSQDSSVDHDGSFQELLLSASRKNCENLPNVAEAKRRSRLQRQHRLSTLKEGGSQSEEDLTDRQHGHRHPCRSHSKDVFADDATPPSVVMPENLTPLCTTPANPDETPSTASLAETPGTFRTAMPLAGLIGRKMGLGKMDVLTELKKRNLRHILAVILGHLTPESLYRCGQVCKSWKEMILQDKRAAFRRRSHLSEIRASLELGAPVHVPDAETRLTLLKRSALKTVQARSRTSSFCAPRLSSSQVAKTLFNDECLKPCPRCEHPARCHSVKGEGVCSRADCGFQFCTSCLCTFHGSRECCSRSAGRRKSDILLPGSAQSRRNVRRL
uniref:F-box protein 43 n=1 Tax=Scophthalmus maximus TaxID=52904 RepID=A0A8D3AGY4_SCOMX